MRGGGILKELAKNLRAKPVTIRYPVEKVPVPEDFRGRIAIRDALCFGCTICAVVCPTACIDMVPSVREIEVRGKTIVRKRKPEVRLFDCIRCGLCEQYCPTEPKAIYLSKEFAGAGPDKDVVVT